MKRIFIILNGEKKELCSDDLKSVLKDFGANVAISLNDEILTRNLWEQTKLKDNDKIDIIELVPGG